MSDDTPTERLPESVPETSASAKPSAGGMSRGLLITLIVIGGLLLLAIIVLLVVLLQGGREEGDPTAAPTPTESSGSPSPSPTPTPSETSAEPSPSASETVAPNNPPSNAPKIDSFKVSTKLVVCPAPDAPGAQPPPDLHFTWQTSRSDNVVFGINAPGDDATNGSFADHLPEDGSLDRPVSCGPDEETTRYTLTVVGEGGQKVSQTIKVVVKP